MSIKIRVIANPFNIGNGFWAIGKEFEIVGETKCYYVLTNNYRVNKKHLSISGTACGEHSVKVKILNQAV